MSNGLFGTGGYFNKFLFGHGTSDKYYNSGGTVVVDEENTTATNPAMARNMTISNNTTINLRCALICSGILKIESGSTISNNGVNAAVHLSGIGGYPTPRSAGGSNGATGTALAGADGAVASATIALGGAGGDGGGGNSGALAGGNGGLCQWNDTVSGYRLQPFIFTGLVGSAKIAGGGGGGAGGGRSGDIGGGGGGGGGIVHIFAREIIIEGSGRIEALGGLGGSGSGSEYGGGGGGGGGAIILVTQKLTMASTSGLYTTPGTGGPGHVGSNDGSTGSPGGIYIISESGIFFGTATAQVLGSNYPVMPVPSI